jgi:hypothetical protein
VLESHEVSRGQPLRVRVLRTVNGKPTPGRLLPAAPAGRLELLRPAGSDGNSELRFTLPDGAKPGARYLFSVTDAESRVTVFTEVTAR